MRDALEFVNSKDIREHLRKLDYQFNSMELAWLVWQSRTVSFGEKMNTWMEMLEMSDYKIRNSRQEVVWDSMQEMISLYYYTVIQIRREFFEQRGDYVYMYRILRAGETDWENDFCNVYKDPEQCKDAAEKEINGKEDWKYQLRRQNMDNPEEYILLSYMGKDTLEYADKSPLSEEEDRILNQGFQNMWIYFPTPFHKGDIVKINDGHNSSKAFVLDRLCTDDASDYLHERGTMQDMYVRGYFVDEDGGVQQKTVCCYMDLEYEEQADDIYEPEERIEKVISMYLQGRVGLDFLLSIYRRILLKRDSDKVPLNQWFEKELLIEAGVEKRRFDW